MAALLIIRDSNPAIKARALAWVQKAVDGTRISFAPPKRTIPQNDRLHAMLTDVMKQAPLYHGVRLSMADWKLVFLDALNTETKLVPNMAGTGFVMIGRHTSDLSAAECSDLIELVFMYGADPEHPVIWSDPKDKAPSPATAQAMEPA